jgi:DHA1 family bicyclomycin/chloramphenicol resistance-like MFS transporter
LPRSARNDAAIRRARDAVRRKPSLALLAAITALAFSALHIVLPALPILTHAFDESPARVQLVVTLFLAGIAAGQLFYGPISDRFGRRPVLLAGLLLFLAGTLLCGMAWSLPALIVGRVLQALGACVGIVLGRAIIRDVHEREAAARGLAIVMMTMTLVPGVSPAIGAYLAEWIDWRAIFAVLGMLGAIVLAFAAIRLPETNPHPVRLDLVGMARAHMRLARSPEYLAFALCGACSSASWFTFCASAPYVLSDLLHQPASTYGTMILLPMATYMLGNGLAARLAPVIGSLRLILAGRGLAFAAAVGMAAWWWFGGLSVWMLFVPIAFTSIGDGLSQPAAMASGLSVYPRLAGTASGLMGFSQMAIAALGTIAVAALPHDSPLGLIAVVGLFIAVALAAGIIGVALNWGSRQIARASGAPAVDNAAGNLRQVREDSA